MILDAKRNHFVFNLYEQFFPAEITAKYETYLQKLPNVIETVPDLINHSIQGISLPSLRLTPATQVSKWSKETDWRSSEPAISTREVDVTFRLTEGFLTYWIMYDLYFHYLYTNEKNHIEQLRLIMVDSRGYALATITLKEITYIGLSELSLSYADNIRDFDTFTCTFTFNTLDIKIETDQLGPPFADTITATDTIRSRNT